MSGTLKRPTLGGSKLGGPCVVFGGRAANTPYQRHILKSNLEFLRFCLVGEGRSGAPKPCLDPNCSQQHVSGTLKRPTLGGSKLGRLCVVFSGRARSQKRFQKDSKKYQSDLLK